MGYKIGYCHDCVVRYPTKSYSQLLRDIEKYGKGAVVIAQKSSFSILSFLMPMKLTTLNENMAYRDIHFIGFTKLRVWFLIWWAKVHFGYGMLMGLLTLPRPLSLKERGEAEERGLG